MKTAKGALRAVATHWNNQEAQVASQTPCIRTLGVVPGWQCLLKLPRLFQCADESDAIALELFYSKSGPRTRGFSLPWELVRNAES